MTAADRLADRMIKMLDTASSQTILELGKAIFGENDPEVVALKEELSK